MRWTSATRPGQYASVAWGQIQRIAVILLDLWVDVKKENRKKERRDWEPKDGNENQKSGVSQSEYIAKGAAEKKCAHTRNGIVKIRDAEELSTGWAGKWFPCIHFVPAY